MEFYNHTYDSEINAYVVPRELMIETMEIHDSSKADSRQTIESLVDDLKEEWEENKKLQSKLDYALNGIDPDCIDEWKKDKQENKKLKEQLEREGRWVNEGQREANAEIEKLKAENKKLKDCNYEEYSSIVGKNKLIKEFEDLNNECGELFDKNKELKKEAEVREDWIHNVMRCLEVYEEWEGAGGDETADDLADRVARENEINSEEIKKLEGLREIIRTELGCEPDPTHETILVAIVELKKKAGLGGRVWGNPNETEDGEIHGF